jgi:hypothetical protein
MQQAILQVGVARKNAERSMPGRLMMPHVFEMLAHVDNLSQEPQH